MCLPVCLSAARLLKQLSTQFGQFRGKKEYISRYKTHTNHYTPKQMVTAERFDMPICGVGLGLYEIDAEFLSSVNYLSCDRFTDFCFCAVDQLFSEHFA